MPKRTLFINKLEKYYDLLERVYYIKELEERIYGKSTKPNINSPIKKDNKLIFPPSNPLLILLNYIEVNIKSLKEKYFHNYNID